MSAKNVSAFIKALEAVKQGYTCKICSDLCKNPVTLSKCFHMICREHLEDLKHCPVCDVPLEDGKTFYDDRLVTCIESAKALDQIFDRYKSNPKVSTSEGGKNANTSKSDYSGKKVDSLLDFPINKDKVQKKKTVSKKENTPDNSAKENKVNQTKASNKTKNDTNTSANLKKKDNTSDNSAKENKVSQNKASNKTKNDLNTSANIKKKENTPDNSAKEHKVNQTKASNKTGNDPNTLANLNLKKESTDNSAKENKATNKTKNDLNTSANINLSSKTNKDIEKRNLKGETALQVACRLGKVERVMELLNQGANPNTKDNAGWTPLHEVVQSGRLDLVKLLLQHNALVNVPGLSNETPLHEAVRYGHKDIAEELVKNGADVHAKNCKGETPMRLAARDVKEILKNAAENIILTQSNNITLNSEIVIEQDFEDIRVYCTSQFKTILNKLKVLAKHHSNVHIEAKMTKNVTHLIVDTEDGVCQSSLDVLQGIVKSIWILTSDWIVKSTQDKLEPFEKHEVVGVGTPSNKGPKNSRYNKYKQYPGIFDGCHFYFHNFTAKYEISKTIVLTKAILTKLVTDAGGVVLRRAPNPESIPESEKLVPYHAKKDGKLVNCSHYIIFKDMYEPMYNMQHLKALPIGWLIECIEKYELSEPW